MTNNNSNKYVILTGSKNNAGDYLIKHRAKALLKEVRADRQIIDCDGWKNLSKENIAEINSSKALILTGGPAITANIRKNVYPLTPNLNDIKVPIIMMGVGLGGTSNPMWDSTHKIEFDNSSLELINRVENSGYMSSVRDYYTLNALFSNEYKNFIMTGCPALYSLEHFKIPITIPDKIEKISFSAGVSFAKNKSMNLAQKDLILKLRDSFAGSDFKVVFHHATSSDIFKKSYGKIGNFFKKQEAFIKWLEDKNINYIDISGSEEKLIEHYSNIDLHIGYRVHAHIFMSSISKPSMLLTEDIRSNGLKTVISGLIIDSYFKNDSNFHKINPKLGVVYEYLRNKANENLSFDVINNLFYEIDNKAPRFKMVRDNINNHFEQMQRFLKQLP